MTDMEKAELGPKTLLYPMPAVLVGAKVDEKPNFMTAAWCGIASHSPPALSVALRKERYTLKGVEEQGCGIYSGKKKDKSQIFRTFYGVLQTAPLIQECPVNLECKVIHSLDLGSHTLVVGEIVETHVSKDSLTNGNPDPEKIDPLIYTPDVQRYHRLGEVIGKAFHMGKEK
jgi:flavin reductase (DIM6/NTAB) family NADH-FMN oxidoreductase RutF